MQDSNSFLPQGESDSKNDFGLKFISNMSLELRVPLNTIIGYSEMLRDDFLAAGNNQDSEVLTKVVDSAKYLLNLINDVLDISKIETNSMELFVEDIRLDALVKESEAQILTMLNDANSFKVNVSDEIDPFLVIRSDPNRIKQSLINLISTILNFNKSGAITLEIKPQPENKEVLKFSVSSTGMGLSTEQLKKIFESFSQDMDTARQYGITGLSLYLTRKIAEILGGGITIEAEENNNAIFSLILPGKIETSSLSLIKAKFTEITEFNEKALLVIDSTPALHRDLQNTLGKEKYTLLHAFDCSEGLALARINKPKIIVLDVPENIVLDMMSPLAMDGWAALSALKAEPCLAKAQIIVLSAVTEKNLGFSLSGVDYLDKPIDIRFLANKIRDLTLVEA